MKFRVRELRRAQADIRQIAHWLAGRSFQDALAWLDAYDEMVARLEQSADSCGLAEESDECEMEVRQALSKTRRGRTYRALFTIEGDHVFLLRIRGPGHAPVNPDELV
jgi:hypothetical protein